MQQIQDGKQCYHLTDKHFWTDIDAQLPLSNDLLIAGPHVMHVSSGHDLSKPAALVVSLIKAEEVWIGASVTSVHSITTNFG